MRLFRELDETSNKLPLTQSISNKFVTKEFQAEIK